jgi:hypothetical protein
MNGSAALFHAHSTVVQKREGNCEGFVRIAGTGGWASICRATVAAVDYSNQHQQGVSMNRTYIGAAVAAALGLAGISAHASCADPQVVAKQGLFHALPAAVAQSIMANDASSSDASFENIVGTWHVTYTVEGQPFADAFIQWHNDGTEFETIDLPLLGGNICLGNWKRIDANHFSRNHIGFLYNNGLPNGYFTETEVDVVSSTGKAYHGHNTQSIYDVNGNLVVTVTGTSSAVRLAP